MYVVYIPTLTFKLLLLLLFCYCLLFFVLWSLKFMCAMYKLCVKNMLSVWFVYTVHIVNSHTATSIHILLYKIYLSKALARPPPPTSLSLLFYRFCLNKYLNVCVCAYNVILYEWTLAKMQQPKGTSRQPRTLSMATQICIGV